MIFEEQTAKDIVIANQRKATRVQVLAGARFQIPGAVTLRISAEWKLALKRLNVLREQRAEARAATTTSIVFLAVGQHDIVIMVIMASKRKWGHSRYSLHSLSCVQKL